MMARLFPQIETLHRQVIRDMVWRELFRYGEAGAARPRVAGLSRAAPPRPKAGCVGGHLVRTSLILCVL
jgi:hypothetical protein